MASPGTTVVVFDIDGTLADLTHRRHHVEAKPKNWSAFFEGMADDKPHGHMIWLARCVFGRCQIILCSGRNEAHREVTLAWLKKHKVPFDDLFMRNDGDHRQDSIVKVELLEEIRGKYGEPYIWFDDRQQVVDAIRKEGVKVCQVDEGAF